MYHLNQQRWATLVKCKLRNEWKGHSAPNTTNLTSFCKQSCYIHAPMHWWRSAQPSARVVSKQKLQQKRLQDN